MGVSFMVCDLLPPRRGRTRKQPLGLTRAVHSGTLKGLAPLSFDHDQCVAAFTV
jgi:hypothetical protein